MINTQFLSNGENKYAVKRVEDVEPLIEHAKTLRAAGAVGTKDMKHAAEFPATVVENYIARKGITFAEFMADESHVRALLNDPDLKGFRIWEGRH
jgi:hypothetical protein